MTSTLEPEATGTPQSGALGRLARVNAWAEQMTIRLEPFSISGWMSRKGPLQDGPSWGWLLIPGILGFLATTAIAVGGALPDSPFKFELRGTWFFGEPQVASHHYGTAMLLSTLVLVYGGLVLLLRTWIHLIWAMACRSLRSLHLGCLGLHLPRRPVVAERPRTLRSALLDGRWVVRGCELPP